MGCFMCRKHNVKCADEPRSNGGNGSAQTNPVPRQLVPMPSAVTENGIRLLEEKGLETRVIA